jgi:cob(I)alamin adenosyltransferase
LFSKKGVRSATHADTANANMPIYTRTGDSGTTALFGGKRVLKCEELIDVYGSIDELNSWVGLIAGQIDNSDIKKFLQTIQSDLFTIGSAFAGWKGDLSHLEARILDMEKRIDVIEKKLPELQNFILPGGNTLGSYVHIARSVCRRVERQTVAFSQKNTVNQVIIKYLNRLSDLFFDLARYINSQANVAEVIWSGIPRQQKSKE